MELGQAGLILSAIAVAGLVGTPVGGLLADRLGPRRPAATGLVLAAAGTAGMIGIRSTCRPLSRSRFTASVSR
ncbi:MFS transporter [Microbispora siamensis]